MLKIRLNLVVRREESLRNGLFVAQSPGSVLAPGCVLSGPWVPVRTCPCDDAVRHLHAGGTRSLRSAIAIVLQTGRIRFTTNINIINIINQWPRWSICFGC